MLKNSLLLAVVPTALAVAQVELPSLHQIDTPMATSIGVGHGAAVAIDGDLLVVGRPGDGTHGDFSGAADVYRQVPTTLSLEGLPWTWIHMCRLHSGNPVEDARFGASVAIDGTTVVVGAWSDQVNEMGDAMGSAWVFEIPEMPVDVLEPSAMLAPADLQDEDYFGWDVAIDGDTIVVGGWGRDVDDEVQRSGAVWVFADDGGSWTQVAQLDAGDDAQADARLGFAVDVAGDLIAAGAPRYGDNQGAVHLYGRQDGSWTPVGWLESPEGDFGERFGTSLTVIALQEDGIGNYGLAVGSPGDGELGPQAGAVWIHGLLIDESTEVVMTQKVTSSAGGSFGTAGTAVDVFQQDVGDDETFLIIGEPGWRNPTTGETTGAGLVLKIDGGDTGDGHQGSLSLGQMAGSGAGSSVGIGMRSMPQFGIAVINGVVGAPGSGEVRVLSVPFESESHDCNEDGRFDLAEVVLLGAQVDCDGDGQHDACQLREGHADCDGNGRLDSCDLADDPSRDCDDNGHLDMCDLNDGADDCDGNGRLDVCDLNEGGDDCNGNGRLDSCDLAEDPGLDCDGSGMPDVCELGPGTDCDANGLLDVCEFGQPDADCDGNGVLDVCDLAADPALDCDGDGQLDSCQPMGPDNDCDGNGRLDSCDLADDPGRDCDGNGRLDFCDLNDGGDDCNGNGRLDSCDLAEDPGLDCDGSGVPDVCELGPETDCDANGLLDMCELGVPGADCDGNSVLDVCELAADPALDCDGDGQLDTCQPMGPENDCDGDGQLDACQIAGDPAVDCDGDGVIDLCQIAGDTSLDCNENGLLDLCEIMANPHLDCDADGVHDDCDSSFEVPEPLWVTQRHEGFLGLSHFGVRLVPTGNTEPPFYDICTASENDLWISSAGHTALSLGDDAAQLVTLPYSFDFAGNLWQDVFVGSNGYLTFGTADTTYAESLLAHFSQPRISVLFDDLDPSLGGEVRVGTGPAGSFVVTWYQVANYSMPGSLNTAQAILHPDNVIELVWSFCDSTSSVIGLSMGAGMPPHFLPTDLGNAWDCVARVPAAWGDCNENGIPDFCEPVSVSPPHWGVEHWFGDADVQNMLVRWQPNGNSAPPIHDVCSTPISALPFDPTQGQVLTMADDASMPWSLPFTFPFAGSGWDGLFISSNGYVTFGTADFGYQVSPSNHFALTRISALFGDLDPSKGGLITVQTGPAGSVVISWLDVPFYGSTHGETATAQLLLHPDGAFEVAYGEITIPLAMAGPSDGLGIPWNFGQTDLSAAWDCQLRHPFDDCNLNGVDDAIEKWLGCSVDNDGDAIPDECQAPPQPYVPACAADVDDSGEVNVLDLLRLLESWGQLKQGDPADACDIWPPSKGDGRVDVDDLLLLVQSLGDPC